MAYKFTTDDYLRASGYLTHHIKMYVNTLIWISKNKFKRHSKVVRNSIIASNLVHTRLLIMFLYKDKSKDTDVVVEDFLQPCQIFWKEEKYKNITDCLDKYFKEISGKFIHLTIKADTTISFQEWPNEEISKLLTPLLQHLLENIPPEKMEPLYKADCLEHLQRLRNTTIVPIAQDT